MSHNFKFFFYIPQKNFFHKNFIEKVYELFDLYSQVYKYFLSDFYYMEGIYGLQGSEPTMHT